MLLPWVTESIILGHQYPDGFQSTRFHRSQEYIMLVRRSTFAALVSLAALTTICNLAFADQEINDSYIETLSRFLKTQNAGNAIEEQMTFSAAQQAFSSLAAQGITITEPMQAIIVDEAHKSFGSKFSDLDFLAEIYAPTYASQLSEAELREVGDFWSSTVGQKMLSVNSALSEGAVAALQEASLPLFPDFEKNVDARLLAAGIVQSP
jgi:hypothetical protein